MWNYISIFLQHSRTYISTQDIRVYSRRISFRGVYEHQLTQNGHKAAMKIIHTGKNWAKLYENIKNFAILTKHTLL